MALGKRGTIPIITLNVEGMRLQIKTALVEYEVMMSKEIQDAVDAYCVPENIRRIVADTVKHTIDESLKNELHTYFMYGNGHTAVVSAINEAMDAYAKYSYVPLKKQSLWCKIRGFWGKRR